MLTTRAYAHTNIALIKYWGKLDSDLNLPATGSLSLTLNGFGTQTEISFTENPQDIFFLNDVKKDGVPLLRVQKFLDVVRSMAQSTARCLVRSKNEVPTKSGLASSASGFAALAMACNQHFDLKLNKTDLSRLARVGSGSAARSIFGGFALMHAGVLADSNSGFAESIEASPKLDVCLIVVQCSHAEKQMSSTEGMNHTARTSPFYKSWIESHDQDLNQATQAVKDGNLPVLGKLMEHSTLKMHATMLAAEPGFSYIEPLTLTVINQVRKLRKSGYNCYFTMDAGPHVKVLCPTSEAKAIASDLRNISDITQINISPLGPGAFVI